MKLNSEDIEAIVGWMNTGGTADISPKRKELFLRAQKAYQRLLEYKSDRIVLQQLKADYLDSYSEMTCKRDLAYARKLFGYREPGSWEFTSGMVIDWALEMMVKAAADRDAKGWSQLAMVLYKFGGGDKAHERPFDPATLANPVPREVVVDPRLVGAKEDPQLMEKLTLLLGEKRMKGIDVPEWPAEEATFEELPPHEQGS
jgi:hypothetical protein